MIVYLSTKELAELFPLQKQGEMKWQKALKRLRMRYALEMRYNENEGRMEYSLNQLVNLMLSSDRTFLRMQKVLHRKEILLIAQNIHKIHNGRELIDVVKDGLK